MKSNVVVLNKIHDDGLDILKNFSDVKFVDNDSAPRDLVLESLTKADAIVVRAFKVTAEVLDRAPRLKFVSKHGVGFETVDIGAASERGILVSNTSGSNSVAVGEFAVTLMLATLRRIPQMHRKLLESGFEGRTALIFNDLWRKTVGIVGFGNIGKIVARICSQGFGCRILVHDPFLTSEQAQEAGVEKVGRLEEMLGVVDVLTLHTPLTPETMGMIGAEQLRKMKPSAIVINTCRGGVIDDDALLQALKDGTIGGAGIDVFDPEPPKKDHPLLVDLPNLVLSPHLGGATHSSRSHTAVQAAEAVIAALKGEKPRHLLNPEVWESSRLVRSQKT